MRFRPHLILVDQVPLVVFDALRVVTQVRIDNQEVLQRGRDRALPVADPLPFRFEEDVPFRWGVVLVPVEERRPTSKGLIHEV